MSESDIDSVYYIRFHARGGQGGVTAAQLCVEAFSSEVGRAQPKFGAERMGSPTEAYATMSKNPKLVQAQTIIYTPQYVGVLDQTLFFDRSVNLTAGMPPGGTIIINTTMSFENLKKLIKDTYNRDDLNIARIDATGIAMDIIGRPITNTAILGALCKVSGLFTLDELKSAIGRVFSAKIAETNYKVIDRAYNEVEVEKCGVELDLEKGKKKEWSHIKPELPGYKDVEMGAVWYLPGASTKVKTGTWGIYDILWDEKKCINCQRCFLTCPDFSIKREKQPDGTWKVTGVDSYHCKACRCCVEICPSGALTAKIKEIGMESEGGNSS
ncbi:MAG: 2-oxoacid:acceptor oxidoreductase family protein [Candidatus Helarchaeota archaeon]